MEVIAAIYGLFYFIDTQIVFRHAWLLTYVVLGTQFVSSCHRWLRRWVVAIHIGYIFDVGRARAASELFSEV